MKEDRPRSTPVLETLQRIATRCCSLIPGKRLETLETNPSGMEPSTQDFGTGSVIPSASQDVKSSVSLAFNASRLASEGGTGRSTAGVSAVAQPLTKNGMAK